MYSLFIVCAADYPGPMRRDNSVKAGSYVQLDLKYEKEMRYVVLKEILRLILELLASKGEINLSLEIVRSG